MPTIYWLHYESSFHICWKRIFCKFILYFNNELIIKLQTSPYEFLNLNISYDFVQIFLNHTLNNYYLSFNYNSLGRMLYYYIIKFEYLTWLIYNIINITLIKKFIFYLKYFLIIPYKSCWICFFINNNLDFVIVSAYLKKYEYFLFLIWFCDELSAD